MEIEQFNISNAKTILDDFIIVFRRATKDPHALFKELNEIDATLKFTIQHTSQSSESEQDRCQRITTFKIWQNRKYILLGLTLFTSLSDLKIIILEVSSTEKKGRNI